MRFYKEVIQPKLKDGSIIDCKRQIRYELQPKCKYKNENILAINYKADFILIYADGSEIVWDVKGQADATAKIKKKMFHYKYPEIDYRWITYSKIDNGWQEYSIVEKARKERKKAKEKLNKTKQI
jgi:hypothetical protein